MSILQIDREKDFPLTKEYIYLDSAASTLTPVSVADAMYEYYVHERGTVHRGVYELSHKATAKYEYTRERVAKFLNARECSEIVFMKGTTAIHNFIAMSLCLSNILQEGDEIIISEAEHHSTFLPFQRLAKLCGATVKYVPLTEKGEVTVENFNRVFTPKTKIVALALVTNVLGTVQDIKEMARITHGNEGALFICDAAQAIPHMCVDVQVLDVDFLTFSAHKILGPTGLGILYGKLHLLNMLEPVELGGEMADNISVEAQSWKETPYRFEAGTPSIAEVICFSKALDYVEALGMENIHAHEAALKKYAVEKLKALGGITIYNEETSSGIVTYTIDGVHPHDAASVYDSYKIAVRAGKHCAHPLHTVLGIEASLRASFYIYTTEKEIDALVDATKAIKEFFL